MVTRTLLKQVLSSREILDKNLPQLIEYYPLLGERRGYDAHPSSWFVINNSDGKVLHHNLEICHASMVSYDANYWDELVTACPITDDISLAYQQMLMTGPFKAFSDLVSLERYGDNHYYIHCTGLDQWPANALYNYCIATRIPIEHQYLMPNFGKFLEKGYDPTLSFLLSYSTRGTNKTVREFPDLGHYWHDPSASWHNILHGDLQLLGRPFKEKPGDSRPCNVIWGTSEDYRQLIKMPAEAVADFYGLKIKHVYVPKPTMILPPMKKKPAGDPYHVLVPAIDGGLLVNNQPFHQQLAYQQAVQAFQVAQQQAALGNPIQEFYGHADNQPAQPQPAEPIEWDADDDDDDLAFLEDDLEQG